MITSLSKSLIEASNKVMAEEAKKDDLYQAMLVEYKVVNPFELSPAKEEEFVALAEMVIGENYAPLKKLSQRLDMFATKADWKAEAAKRVIAETYTNPKLNESKKK